MSDDSATGFFAQGNPPANSPTAESATDFFSGKMSANDATKSAQPTDVPPPYGSIGEFSAAKRKEFAASVQPYIPKTPGQAASDFFLSGIGTGEAALSLGSGMVSGTLAAAARLGDRLRGTPEDMAGDTAAIENALHYQPRTDIGKGEVAAIGGLMAPANEAAYGATSTLTDPETAKTLGDIAQVAPVAYGAVRGVPGIFRGSGESEAPAGAASGAGFGPDSASAARSSVMSQFENAPAEVQAAVAQKTAGGKWNDEAVRAHADASTLPVPVDLSEGQATGDPGLISAEQNSRAAHPEFAQRFDLQNIKLASNVRAIREQAGPDVYSTDATSHAQTMIDADKATDQAWRAHVSEPYNEAKALNGGDIVLDGQGVTGAIDSELKAANRARFVPASVDSILSDYRKGQAMTVNDWDNLQTITAAEIRKAQRAGDGNAEYALGIVQNGLKNMEMPEGLAPQVRGLLLQGKARAAERFQYIRDNPSYKAAVDDEDTPIGQPSPIADKYVQNYLIKGNSAQVAAMRDRFRGGPVSDPETMPGTFSPEANPTAEQSMGVATVDHLRRQSGLNDQYGGNFTQAGYNRAMQGIGRKLNYLVSPAVADNLEKLGNTARRTQIQPRGSWVNNSNTFVAAARQFGLSALEGWLNVKTGGVPIASWIKQGFDRRTAQAAVDRALAPGAGIDRTDVAPRELEEPMDRGTPPAGGGGGPTGGPQGPTAPPAPPPRGPAPPPPPAAPTSPGAAPQPAPAPRPAPQPRGGAPKAASSRVEATSRDLAAQLEVPVDAVDGRVRGLSAKIKTANNAAARAKTPEEQEYHTEMARALHQEREQVVRRNLLELESRAKLSPAGRPETPPQGESPVPPAAAPPAPPPPATLSNQGVADALAAATKNAKGMSAADAGALAKRLTNGPAPAAPPPAARAPMPFQIKAAPRANAADLAKAAQEKASKYVPDMLEEKAAPPPPAPPPTAAAAVPPGLADVPKVRMLQGMIEKAQARGDATAVKGLNDELQAVVRRLTPRPAAERPRGGGNSAPLPLPSGMGLVEAHMPPPLPGMPPRPAGLPMARGGGGGGSSWRNVKVDTGALSIPPPEGWALKHNVRDDYAGGLEHRWTLRDATGEHIGALQAVEDNGEDTGLPGRLQVKLSGVDKKGQGYGKILYHAALDHARDNGLDFASDKQMSLDSRRVWKNWLSRGYRVEVRDPNGEDVETHGFLDNDTDAGPLYLIKNRDLRSGHVPY